MVVEGQQSPQEVLQAACHCLLHLFPFALVQIIFTDKVYFIPPPNPREILFLIIFPPRSTHSVFTQEKK